jgi:hypothetical protein
MVETTLGTQLSCALEEITKLVGRCTNQEEFEKLKAQRGEILDKIAQLIDTNLRKESDEYKAATASLEAACIEIKKSIDGINSVASTITSIAKALDLVAKLAPV